MEDHPDNSPEEISGQVDVSNAVDNNPNGPWKNSTGMWTFQNYDDLIANAADVASPDRSPRIVMVIDNEFRNAIWQANKQYYVVWFPGDLDDGTDFGAYAEILQRYLASAQSDNPELTWPEILKANNLPLPGMIHASTWQTIPIFVGNESSDDNRPGTVIETTESKVYDVRTTTVTTTKPGAAGVQTESGITAFGAATQTPADKYDVQVGIDSAKAQAAAIATTGSLPSGPTSGMSESIDKLKVGDIATPEQLRHMVGIGSLDAAANNTKPGAVTRLPDCLPANPEAMTQKAEVHQDKILKDAKAAALGAKISGADPTKTAPTTVTSSGAGSAAAEVVTPSAYIYAPLTPGFDRYDFNKGKKVYTPDSGPSKTAASQPLTGPQ